MNYKELIQKTAIVVMAMTGLNNPLMAEDADSTSVRPAFGVEYTSELQTNFKEAKWNNLFELSADIPLSKKITFNVASLSLFTSRLEPLMLDLQGISNLDGWEINFAFTVAGLTWQINDHHSLFAGIRRIDEDYFCSDGLALFTNSSCGGFPTITANLLPPTYPLAAMGIHYAYDNGKWGIQASVYNGEGSYELTGEHNVFRVCPKEDGVFALGQIEYRHRDSRYFLGASMHDLDLLQIYERKIRPAIWTYAEQALAGNLTLIAAYSHAFSDDELCKNFCGIGGKYTYKNVEMGIFTEYTRVLEIDEWATELTCNITFTDHLWIQPALHIVNTDGNTDWAGFLRLGINL